MRTIDPLGVVGNSQEKQGYRGLDRRAKPKKDCIVTADEVLEDETISYLQEPEPSIFCKFCRSELHQKAVISPFSNSVIEWLEHEECICDESVEERQIKEIEEREKKKKQEMLLKQKEMEEKLSKLRENSRMSRRFKTRTFENFNIDDENKTWYNNSVTYADNFEGYAKDGMGIFFNGSNGTGKTHLAASIANRLLSRAISVLFMTTGDLLSEIRRTYDKNRHISEHELLSIYKNVDLLILDDLGQENSTSWGISQLYDILNDRYENYKPVVITTNYNDKELIDKLTINNDYKKAQAIVSRLHEVTMSVQMIGRDRRK